MSQRDTARSNLHGTVTRITYQNEQGRYTVARLQAEGPEEITIVGEIFPLSVGEEIKVSGFWTVHRRYGLQFQVEGWEKVEPATLEGVERYLGSGLIRGIGSTYARRLVLAFGQDTLRVLSQEPHRLLEVPGIGQVRAQRIRRAWEEQKVMRDALLFLHGLGVGTMLALRIYRAFGNETVARVKANPYSLAREVYGVGFVLADRVAGAMGIRGNDPLRVQAGVLHVLAKFADEGHCFVPGDLLRRSAAEILGVRDEEIERAVRRLAAKGEVMVEGGDPAKVYRRELYQAECRVASAVRNLLWTPSGIEHRGAPLNLFGPANLVLEEEQRAAVEQALARKVLVITGGPGTGKTTILTLLLACFRDRGISFALAAPTGRAAKRISELTGEEAKTIHRLLEYDPGERRFKRGDGNRLEADVVIIDEASMVDLELMDGLLRAIDPESRLILLGDVDQLPSVGPGSVLRDLIDSGRVPVVVLKRVFRQAGESLIVTNAHRILEGKPLVFGAERRKRDFVFMPRETEEEILEAIKGLVREQPAREVQVLSPMHRGPLGTVELNRELQRLLNPEGEALEWGAFVFRAGDKVMQLRNNYDKGTFNGDVGRIISIDRSEDKLQVDFYGRAVAYGFEELDELSLAYAISIHKSQGSEYPAVIVPLHTSHYPMLYRSILYTAVTRAKELVIVVGNRRALWMAIKNVRTEDRFTGLKERLRS